MPYIIPFTDDEIRRIERDSILPEKELVAKPIEITTDPATDWNQLAP